MELWKLVAPSQYDYAKIYIRKQLSLHGDYLGLQWCSEDVSNGFAQWAWADTETALVVAISDLGTVNVFRGPEPNARKGCQ
jgi:hypothetical protein